MSWIGGSLSSLTGQISNLTKDILTEGTEEVSDHATELRLAEEKIKEYETVCSTQKSENDRLKALSRELEEKAESSELQINSISREYRTLLEEKQNEVKLLKQKHHEMLEHQMKTSLVAPTGGLGHGESTSSLSSSIRESGFDGSSYQSDDLDFGDNISMQHEINRLSHEVQRLQTECDHWKKVATEISSLEVPHHEPQAQTSNRDIIDLQQQVKELQQKLASEKEQHQQEVASLQDVYSQKSATLRKKHKQEVSDLKHQIEDLEEQITSDEYSETVQQLKQELATMHNELQSMSQRKTQVEEENRNLQETLHKSHTRIQELEAEQSQVRVELYDTKQRLLDQLDANHQRELKSSVSELEKDQALTSAEAECMLNEMGDPEHQQLTADIIDSVEKENLLLKQRNVELQEQVALLEKAMHTVTQERQHWEGRADSPKQVSEGHQQGQDEHQDLTSQASLPDEKSDLQSMTSDLSELSRKNNELDSQVQTLKSQISNYEREIEQFEFLKSDWQMEKEALEDVLMQLREQLREKERTLTVVEAQKGLVEVKRKDPNGKSKNSKNKQDKTSDGLLEVEKQENAFSREATDESDADSDDIAADIEKLDQQVELLTQANAQLENERNMLLFEKEDLQQEVDRLRGNLDIEVAPLVLMQQSDDGDSVSILERKVATLLQEKQDLESSMTEMSDYKEQVRQTDEVVANLTMEKQELEVSLEELDTQHEEAMEQVIKLRDGLLEQVEVLKQTIAERDEHITQLTEHAAELAEKRQDGKMEAEESFSEEKLQSFQEEVSNLKAADSEMQQKISQQTSVISSLEASLVKRDADLKDIKEKISNSAIALNELHMDKKELENEVLKCKKELAEKIDKIKVLREENKNLQEKCNELNEKCQVPDGAVRTLGQTLSSQEGRGDGTEMEVLQKQLNSTAEEKTLLQAKVVGIESELNEVKLKNIALEEENMQVRTDIDTVKDENVSLSDEKLQELKAQLKSSTENADAEHQELLNRIEGWNSEKASLETELKEFVSKKNLMEEEKLKLRTEIDRIEDEKSVLREEKSRLASELQELELKFEKYAEKNDEQQQELLTHIDALKSEKNTIEKELGQTEQKLQSQTKHYESYVQELQKSKEMDSTSVQQEHQRLMQECHHKDLEISEMASQMDDLREQANDAKEMMQSAIDSQKQLSDLISEKENEILGLKRENATASEELDKQYDIVQQQECLIHNFHDTEHQLSVTRQDNHKLKSEIDTLRKQVQETSGVDKVETRTLDVINDLESELTAANDRIQELQATIKQYQETVHELELSITELNENYLQQSEVIAKNEETLANKENMIAVLRQNIVQNDAEIMQLKKLHHASSDAEKPGLSHGVEVMDSNGIAASEFPLDGSTGVVRSVGGGADGEIMISKHAEFIESSSGTDITDQEDFDNEEDIINKIEELEKTIHKKDSIISEMRTNNGALLKLLDSKSSVSDGDKTLVDIYKLQNEVRTLKLEREHMMAVMNEKSRECSNLKGEVHRLMSVVSAEKVALEKLQKDNHELTQKTSPVDEMQREALQNLSRLIRDKDLEVESMRQKNETLVAVLQESSEEGMQVNGLMQDKQNLGKQLSVLQGEREQMITYLNQKHQESLNYHGEIQRLTAYIQEQTEKHEQLQAYYEKLAPKFEDQQQTLLKTQNELFNYKQKYTELEVKYGGLLQRSGVDDTVDMLTYSAKLDEVSRLEEKQAELFENLKKKDHQIQKLHQRISELDRERANVEMERNNYRKQVDSLTFEVQGLHAEVGDLKTETTFTRQKSLENNSENQMLREMNNQLTLTLQQREFELRSIHEKSESLTSILQEQEGEKGQVDRLIQEKESVQQQLLHLQQERDQALMALQQQQAINNDLYTEIQMLKEKETKLSRELDRLRNHLLQMEEGYTKEALDAEEREKDLRNRLSVAEEKLLSSTNAVQNASQYTSQQIDSLQQQLHVLSGQRDQSYLQVASLQEQCQQYSLSLVNLQLVLEQFQQEKENQVALETERCQREIQSLEKQVKLLQSQLEQTKTQLEEAADGLEAAARLSEQLDKKEGALLALKEEVQLREDSLKAAEAKIQNFVTSTEAKVDKIMIKNLLLGYFSMPQNKRQEVLRTIGGVLSFSPDDFQKIEGEGKGWIPGFLRFGGSPVTPVRSRSVTPKADRSFSELFVTFMEKESSPPPPTARLPAEDMVRDVQQKQREAHSAAFNPFTAPRHVAIANQKGSSDSHILMSSGPHSPILPMFTPVTAREGSLSPSGSGRSTPSSSSAILKDVLGSQ